MVLQTWLGTRTLFFILLRYSNRNVWKHCTRIGALGTVAQAFFYLGHAARLCEAPLRVGYFHKARTPPWRLIHLLRTRISMSVHDRRLCLRTNACIMCSKAGDMCTPRQVACWLCDLDSLQAHRCSWTGHFAADFSDPSLCFCSGQEDLQSSTSIESSRIPNPQRDKCTAVMLAACCSTCNIEYISALLCIQSCKQHTILLVWSCDGAISTARLDVFTPCWRCSTLCGDWSRGICRRASA